MEFVGVNNEVHRIFFSGPWSIMEWAMNAKQKPLDSASKISLNFSSEMGNFILRVGSNTQHVPLDRNLYLGFCDGISDYK